jgi:hypothetical protein
MKEYRGAKVEDVLESEGWTIGCCAGCCRCRDDLLSRENGLILIDFVHRIQGLCMREYLAGCVYLVPGTTSFGQGLGEAVHSLAVGLNTFGRSLDGYCQWDARQMMIVFRKTSTVP